MVALAVALALAAATPPSYAELPPDLAAAARAFDQAQIASDGAALAGLLADDYRLVNSSGKVEDKAQFVADYTTHGFRLDPFEVREPVFRSWPGGALLGGLVTYAGVQDGTRFSIPMRFADVWALRDGRWRVVYTQVTRVPGP